MLRNDWNMWRNSDIRISSFVIIMVNIRSSRNHTNLGEIFEGAEYLYDLKTAKNWLLVARKNNYIVQKCDLWNQN